jgi:hypothetical protein
MSFLYVGTSGGRWDLRLRCSPAPPAEVIDACNDTAVAIVRTCASTCCVRCFSCAPILRISLFSSAGMSATLLDFV